VNLVKLIRKSFTTSIGYVVQIAAGFALARLLSIVIISVLAHTLAIAEYADFLYAFSVAHIVAQVAGLGWYSLIRKKSATFHDTKNSNYCISNESKGFFIASFMFPICWMVLAIMILYGSIYFKFSSGQFEIVIKSAMTLVLPLLLANIFREYLVGLGAIRAGVLLGEVMPLLSTLSAISLSADLKALNIIATLSISYIFSVFVQAIFLKRLMPQNVFYGKPVIELKGYLISSFQRALGAGSRFLTDKVDVILIAPIVGVVQMAEFNSANRISLVILLIPLALMEYFSSRVSRDYHQGEFEKVKKHVIFQIKVLTVLLVPVWIVSVLFGKNILQIVFGEGFQFSSDLLAILLLANILFAYSLPFSSLLLMTDGERSYAWVNLLSLITCFIACFYSASYYGSIGAAISLLLANSLLALSTVYFGWKSLRI
jgi:O-antigen/teichoic acid export membrane protein